MLFDAIAIRVDGPRAWGEHLTVDVVLEDQDARYRLTLANGALTYSRAVRSDAADATLTCTRAALPHLALGPLEAAVLQHAGIAVSGDAGALSRLGSVLETPDPDFAIVTAESK